MTSHFQDGGHDVRPLLAAAYIARAAATAGCRARVTSLARCMRYSSCKSVSQTYKSEKEIRTRLFAEMQRKKGIQIKKHARNTCIHTRNNTQNEVDSSKILSLHKFYQSDPHSSCMDLLTASYHVGGSKNQQISDVAKGADPGDNHSCDVRTLFLAWTLWTFFIKIKFIKFKKANFERIHSVLSLSDYEWLLNWNFNFCELFVHTA